VRRVWGRDEGTVGWLRCGERNTAAHRFCLGLGPSSQLGNMYVCCWCETWRASDGGEAAERAAARASRDITALEGEALERSSADTYMYRLEAVKKWALGVGSRRRTLFRPAHGSPWRSPWRSP